MIQNDLLQLAHSITELKLLPGNPRRGDIEAVKRSLEAFGQRKPIVVRRSDNVVIAGNHTLQAAQALGWAEIAVVWVDDDEVTSKAFALADNRTAELGDYDEEALADLINDVGSLNPGLLESSGWDDKAVQELLNRVEQVELPIDIDDVPDKAPSITNTGDVWLLGKHKVMCGDSTSIEKVKELMSGLEADLVWTDPPYGVAIVGGNRGLSPDERRAKGGKEIENDELDFDALKEFLTKAFIAGHAVTKKGGCWYVAAPAGNIFQAFSIPLTDLGLWRHTLVWVKDSLVMGRADYHYRHESIFYGWKEGAAHQSPPDRKQDTVWEIPRPKRSTEHPTMKPIELVVKAIENSTNQNHVVLDLFGGSGSTLIAAQETNRIAYLMELDPHYVDVICARFQKLTGVLPVLKSSGKVHDFLNA
jgi:site-specific DNA-methyltransferase (adenine-specific)